MVRAGGGANVLRGQRRSTDEGRLTLTATSKAVPHAAIWVMRCVQRRLVALGPEPDPLGIASFHLVISRSALARRAADLQGWHPIRRRPGPATRPGPWRCCRG